MAYIPYGFVQNPTGIFIEPQQAKVIRQIYQRYLEGDSLKGIADRFARTALLPPRARNDGPAQYSVACSPIRNTWDILSASTISFWRRAIKENAAI